MPAMTTADLPRTSLGLSPAAWYTVGVALVLFDAVMSAAVISTPAGEANPLLAALMARVGVPRALGLRALFGSVLLSALYLLARRSSQARGALVLASVVHAAVAGWHVAGPLALRAA